MGNFSFQVIYIQLELEIKAIITVLSFPFGGQRYARCFLKNWPYLAIRSFISFYLNIIISNSNTIQKMSWPFFFAPQITIKAIHCCFVPLINLFFCQKCHRPLLNIIVNLHNFRLFVQLPTWSILYLHKLSVISFAGLWVFLLMP